MKASRKRGKAPRTLKLPDALEDTKRVTVEALIDTLSVLTMPGAGVLIRQEEHR